MCKTGKILLPYYSEDQWATFHSFLWISDQAYVMEREEEIQFYKKEKKGGMHEHAMYKQYLKVKSCLLPVSTHFL